MADAPAGCLCEAARIVWERASPRVMLCRFEAQLAVLRGNHCAWVDSSIKCFFSASEGFGEKKLKQSVSSA